MIAKVGIALMLPCRKINAERDSDANSKNIVNRISYQKPLDKFTKKEYTIFTKENRRNFNEKDTNANLNISAVDGDDGGLR